MLLAFKLYLMFFFFVYKLCHITYYISFQFTLCQIAPITYEVTIKNTSAQPTEGQSVNFGE